MTRDTSSPAAPLSTRTPRLLIRVAVFVFAVAFSGMIGGVEPFASWFYVFAWWSYILLLDGWVHLRRGSSMLLSRPRAFLALLPWSCAFWLFFEVVNWRLANWYYVGLPAVPLARGAGIFISFATVLPGILETADLLRSFGVGEKRGCQGEYWRVTALRRRVMVVIGLAFLFLPLLFPRYFFPLIWGATVLLAEPFLARRGEPCLWSHLAAGRPAIPWRLLLAGALCGLLWESWNYWAAAKWIYTVPWFEESKLFEMPFVGFLGFPPFALECYTFARLLVALGLVGEWDPTAPVRERAVPARGVISLVVGVLCLPVIAGVDRWTVRSIAWQPEELSRLNDGQLELARTAWMGSRGLAWLESIGIRDVETLAKQKLEELFTRLETDAGGPAPTPTRAEIRVWWRAARRRGFVVVPGAGA